MQTVAINVPVRIAGVQVRPGDLVLADEVGVCFVPHECAAQLLRIATRIGERENERQQKIKAGTPVIDLSK